MKRRSRNFAPPKRQLRRPPPTTSFKFCAKFAPYSKDRFSRAMVDATTDPSPFWIKERKWRTYRLLNM
jgi:hypothetical protein